jgi:hypothetical protein
MKQKEIGKENLDFYLFTTQFFQEINEWKTAEKMYNEGLYLQLPGNKKLVSNFNTFLREKDAFLKSGEFKKPSSSGCFNRIQDPVDGKKVLKRSTLQGVGVKRSNIKATTSLIYQDGDADNKENIQSTGKWHGDAPGESTENIQKAGKWTGSGGLKSSSRITDGGSAEKVQIFADCDDDDADLSTSTLGISKRRVNNKMEKVLHKHKEAKDVMETTLDPNQTVQSKLIYKYPKQRCASAGETFL